MLSYIIQTDDISFAYEKVDEIKKGLKKDYDTITYDFEDDGVYPVVDELGTISLFDNPKFVIAKSGELLLSTPDEKFKELIMQMADISSENVLVIISTKGYDIKGDKKPRLDALKKYGAYFDLALKNISLDDYAKRELDREGYLYDSDVIKQIASSCDSLTAIHSAVEVLKCYRCDTKKITLADVNLMITKPLDNDVYALVNAVLKKDRKHVFELYADFKLQKIDPSYLLQLLINKFQELNNIYILVKSHMTQDEIATLYNIKPGRAYYMMKDAKSLAINDIKANLEYLTKLDYDIKRGEVTDTNLALELFFLR